MSACHDTTFGVVGSLPRSNNVSAGRKIEEFDPEREEWPVYVECLEFYLDANSITDESKKRSVLLSVIPSAYKLVRSLLAPAKPKQKAFKELTELMTRHYNPVPSEIVQRYKFHTRFRQPMEFVATFVSKLRALAEHCQFGDTLELMLRDKLVCAINDEAIQKRLLSERELTFEKALRTAQGMEAAAKNLKELHQEGRGVEELEGVDQGGTRTVGQEEGHRRGRKKVNPVLQVW